MALNAAIYQGLLTMGDSTGVTSEGEDFMIEYQQLRLQKWRLQMLPEGEAPGNVLSYTAL